MLEALGSDQPLDTGSLGVGLLALTLGLDLTTDDVLADLIPTVLASMYFFSQTLPELLQPPTAVLG